MPSKCSVESCDGFGGHRFPKEREVKNLWIRALRRIDFVPSISSVICSRHFTDDDYNPIGRETGIVLTRKRLKRGAVPSVALPFALVEPPSIRRKEATCDPAGASSSSRQEDQSSNQIKRPRILRVVSPSKLLRRDVQSQFDVIITGDLDKPHGEYTVNIGGVEDPLHIAASPPPSPSPSTDEREETCRPNDSLPAHIKVKEEVIVENELEAFSTSQNNIKQEEGEDNTSALETLNREEEMMSSVVQELRRDLKTMSESLEKRRKEAEMMESTLVSRINQLENKLQAPDEEEQPRPLKLTYLVERSLQKINDPLYNLVEAEKELRTLEEKSMPPQWSFTVTPRGILLMFANNIGKSTFPVSRCITILPDMTLDIQVVNGPPPKLNLGPMTCLVDILCAMKTTATLRLCTGLNGKCVSKGYLEPDAHVGHERCGDCQTESRRLSAIRTETVITLDPEEESLKAKELISVKRKVAFFKKKLDLAEDHIIQLKSENIKLKRLRDSKFGDGLAVEKALDCIEKHFLSSD